MLTIFPAQALDSSVITTVWVGLCVITLLNLRFGTTLAGLVVPGYLVPLFLIKPASAYVIWAESIVTYLLARLLADQLMRRTGSCTMFGRDRFFALLLVSVFVRVVSDGWLLPMLGRTLADQGWTFDYHNNLYSFGLVIIALTANQMWNGGMARGMGTFVLYVGLTYAIVAGVLIPFTNFDIAGLGFLYEGIASDILASPKAYLILLTTAFIASRMNLHYGWEFSGILIPALLALQWFQPTKLLISILEAVLIFFMGRAALRLPVFRRMNMEGARLLLLFFTLGYVYKLALGFVLTWAFPAVKASDFFAFGYLLSTLLAMKMHQKQISWQITRTTVQTSLMGLVLASIIGYGLAIAWPTDSHIAVESDVQSDHVPTGAALPEQLAIRRRALHASEEGRTPLLFTPAELRDFSDGVRALLRYRTDGRVEQLLAARGALTRGGFLLERAGDWLIVRDANPARGAGLYAVNLRPRTTLAVMVPAPLDESGTFEVGVHLAFADDHSVLASAGTRRQRLPEGRSNVLRNANLPFARFQALTGEAGVLHVRGLATAPGTNAPAQLWIQRAVPEGLDVDALAARTGPVDARYDRRRASNPLRDATSAPFAELLLARPARLRLIARTLGGSSIREVVEQQRVQSGGGPALGPKSLRRGQCESERTGDQERDRRERPPGKPRIQVKHSARHDRDLQDRDNSLFDAVDQDALDRVHILHHAGDEIARRTVIKPAQRQQLDVIKKIAPQIENHALFEAVVQQNAQTVQQVLQKECEERDQHSGQQKVGTLPRDHIVDNELRYSRENDDHERPQNGAGERPCGHPGVTLHISKDAPDCSHARERPRLVSEAQATAHA